MVKCQMMMMTLMKLTKQMRYKNFNDSKSANLIFPPQFAEWRIRELRRIKKEREGRVKRDKDRAEIERRRRLTDAERAHENKVLGSDDTEKVEKTKYRFMQTYYHKGGFFQDSSDPIFQRDYNMAVGEEIRDKTMLPKAMQVRRDKFGKKGQTKYTHLNDQVNSFTL